MNVFAECADLVEKGISCAMATVIAASPGTPGKAGFKLLLAEDGSRLGTVGGGALELHVQELLRRAIEKKEGSVAELDLEALGMRCGGQCTVAVEYVAAAEQFLIFGGGHVGRALAGVLDPLGFRCTVFDSRREITEDLSGPSSPRGGVVLGDYSDIAAADDLLRRCRWFFVATHGHEHDYDVLVQLIRGVPAAQYVGVIGSRRKAAASVERLRKDGLDVPGSLHCPVGLQIGAESAQEIAVSVAAEVVAVRRGAHPAGREIRL